MPASFRQEPKVGRDRLGGQSGRPEVTNSDPQSSPGWRGSILSLELKTMVGAAIFLILATVAGVLAFGGAADFGAALATVLFFFFFVLFLVSVLVVGFAREAPSPETGRR